MGDLIPHEPATRHIVRGTAGGVVLEGVRLPDAPCRAAEADGRAALWLGPDEWLLLGFAAQDTGFAVVDVGHRQLGYRLEGPHAVTLLAAGVPLDLAEAAFPVGMCVRTLFEKAEIVLWRTGAEAWRIEIARSFAPYLHDMIAAIAVAEGI
jgi:sarcosine oxidase subunit gamma